MISVEEEEILIDLNTYRQGVIPREEYSDDPDFHAMDEIQIGQELPVVVLDEDFEGRTVVSLREAMRVDGWENLRQAMQEHRQYEVRVKENVPSGVVVYAEGIRGFIPASKLALKYVEEESNSFPQTIPIQSQWKKRRTGWCFRQRMFFWKRRQKNMRKSCRHCKRAL